jgi:hypothetical protein
MMFLTPGIMLRRVEHKVRLQFSPEELFHYNVVVEEVVDVPEGEESRMHQLAKLKRMQMACNHPTLLETREELRAGMERSDSCSMCGDAAVFRMTCGHALCSTCSQQQVPPPHWL